MAVAWQQSNQTPLSDEQVSALKPGDAVCSQSGEQFEVYAFFTGWSGERRTILTHWRNRHGSWHYEVASDHELRTRFNQVG